MKKYRLKILLLSFILCLFFAISAYADTGVDNMMLLNPKTKAAKNIQDKDSNLINKLKYQQATDISENYKYLNKINDDIKKHSNPNDVNNEMQTVAAFKVFLSMYNKNSSSSKGYNYELVSVKGNKLYLFGVNETKDLLELIGTFDNASISDIKVEVYYVNNYIKIWSQAPYKALEKTILLNWNGKKFSKAASIDSDPSQEFLDNQSRLIKNGSFKEALSAAKKYGGILYPESYESYKLLGKEAITYSQTLAKKLTKSTPSDALVKLEDATDYYCGIYDFNEYKIDIRNVNTFSKNTLTKIQELVPEKSKLQYSDWSSLIYLYGDILNKKGNSKKALDYFTKAIELNENKKEAYLAAGDISWNLKKYDDGRKYYKKYIELSKNSNKSIPQRVVQRAK